MGNAESQAVVLADVKIHLAGIKEHIASWKRTPDVKIPEEVLALEKALDKLIGIVGRKPDVNRLEQNLAAAFPIHIKSLFKLTKGCDVSKPKQLGTKLKNAKDRFKEFEGRMVDCMNAYELAGPQEPEKKKEAQIDDITNPDAKAFWTSQIKTPKMMWVDFKKKYTQSHPKAKPVDALFEILGQPTYMDVATFCDAIGDYGFPFNYSEDVIQKFNEQKTPNAPKKRNKLSGLIHQVMGVDNDLYKAVAAGKTQTVVEFLQKNPKAINSRNHSRSFTPLHLAVSLGHLNMVKAMLKLGGIQTDLEDIEHKTAIDVAAAEDQLEILKLLYPLFQKVNFVFAARATSPATFQWLLTQTKDAIQQMQAVYRGTTALHAAVSRGNQPMVDAILSTEADVNVQDANGRAPLHLAVEDAQLIELLLSHDNINVDIPDAKGITPLMQSVVTGSTDAIAALIVGGADVEAQGKDGKTAVFFLALREGIEKNIVQQLVNAGADLSHQDDNGNNVLHTLALSKESEDVKSAISQLAEHDVPIDQKNNQGRTPLIVAAMTGKAETATSLLNVGANPNAKDMVGMTPLHYASTPQVASVVLEKGGSPNSVDKEGNTPLHVQMQSGNTAVGKLLLSGGAKFTTNYDGQTPISTAALGGNSGGIQVMIETLSEQKFTKNDQFHSVKEIVDHQDKQGNTAAIIAAGKNNATGVQVLGLAGADMNLKNKEGNTVVHVAAAANAAEALKVGLKHGADGNAQNENGDTGTIIGLTSGNNEAAEVLYRTPGVNTAIKNKQGLTATRAAIESGNTTGMSDLTLHNLSTEGAHDGVLCIGLRWEDYNDLDLHVYTPNKIHVYFGNKKADGGQLDVDMNVSMGNAKVPAVEHVFWLEQKTTPSGRYDVVVKNFNHRPEEEARDPCEFQIVISQDTQVKYALDSRVKMGVSNYPKMVDSQFVCSFDYDATTAAITNLAPQSADTKKLELGVTQRKYNGVTPARATVIPDCEAEENAFNELSDFIMS